ncbi:MAG TPA: hypothetical protein VGQ48_02545 [Gemmatimonadales bacterium]|nr:hypothetical protein [Gemmatimonadales bacterium]
MTRGLRYRKSERSVGIDTVAAQRANADATAMTAVTRIARLT